MVFPEKLPRNVTMRGLLGRASRARPSAFSTLVAPLTAGNISSKPLSVLNNCESRPV
ncbi:Uncharacterised protein [Mycobacteroides abscessus subsp. abscessus]|nr:Uncharacterised protein [Mycobacteroides abscessus subsp. abscessus]SIN59373.1 Uncharacterised protein [Mycobacteroides abscessus subsp. abscessus]